MRKDMKIWNYFRRYKCWPMAVSETCLKDISLQIQRANQVSCTISSLKPRPIIMKFRSNRDLGKIFVRSLADCRDEQKLWWPHTRNTYFTKIVQKSHKQTPAHNNSSKISNPWGMRELNFQSYHNIMLKIFSSQKSTEHAKKPENMAHSQRGKKMIWQKPSLGKPRHWKYYSKMLDLLS